MPLFQELGYGRRHARYRNQYTFLPTIECEEGFMPEALRMLLRDTPILPEDNIQNTAWRDFRTFSIHDALQLLGEPKESWRDEGPGGSRAKESER